MKTEEILNEREKTHGNFREAAETHYQAKKLFRGVMEEKGVPVHRIEAIEAIIAKINRIAHGNHDHADHWDDIAGYAMLGKGEKIEPLYARACNHLAGIVGVDNCKICTPKPKEEKDWFKSEPCKHTNKKRQFYTDTAQHVNSIMTADHCLECGQVHIVDFQQKEEPTVREWINKHGSDAFQAEIKRVNEEIEAKEEKKQGPAPEYRCKRCNAIICQSDSGRCYDCDVRSAEEQGEPKDGLPDISGICSICSRIHNGRYIQAIPNSTIFCWECAGKVAGEAARKRDEEPKVAPSKCCVCSGSLGPGSTHHFLDNLNYCGDCFRPRGAL